MIVNLGYKYKLVINKTQKALLFNHLFAHNQAWNILLNESHKQYEQNKVRIKNWKGLPLLEGGKIGLFIQEKSEHTDIVKYVKL